MPNRNDLTVRPGERPSAATHNALVRAALRNHAGAGMYVDSTGAYSRPINRAPSGEVLAMARLTTAGDAGNGWYKAVEIIWDRSSAEWTDVDSGRAWDGSEGNLPEAYAPSGETSLEPDEDETVPVILLRTHDDEGRVMWLIVGRAGDSLPEGSGQYKVLQLDANDKPVWDSVRAHA